MEPTLPRWLRLGSTGRDVRALQRALRRAGFRARTVAIGNTFDAQTEAELMAFQAANQLEVDGVVGPETFRVLHPSFDARGRFILDEVRKELEQVRELNEGGFPEGMSARQKIVAAAHAAFEQRATLRYTQDGRRMQGVKQQIRPPATPQWEDCSSFVTWCYWAAGAPDPNGRGYDGFGFTGTQIGTGTTVGLEQALPGDLVFYGKAPDAAGITHVALYVGNGNVISHGNESGPTLLPVDYRSDRKLIKSYV